MAFEVTYTGPEGDVTEAGEGCIVSSMGNRVPGIVPGLAPDRGQFLRGLNYTSTISINLALNRRPQTRASFVVVPRPVSEGLFAVILEHNKVPGRCPDDKGLCTLFTMNEWAVENMDKDDDAVLANINRRRGEGDPGPLERHRVHSHQSVVPGARLQPAGPLPQARAFPRRS